MAEETNKLFDLVKNNFATELESVLINDPAATESINEQGISLLLIALYYGNKEAAELIRKIKKNLSSWEAACIGDIKQLNDHLINNPAAINEFSPDGFSLLGYACFFSQEAVAEFLILKGVNINTHSQNAMKVAPLHSASAVSNYNLCKLLLEHGADVNAVQQGGYTALHAAAQNGRTDIAALLLDAGAGKNQLTDNGEAATDIAKNKSHLDIAAFIENYKVVAS